jgi:uncharacterized protein YjbI with pentapeptide repeats
MSNGNEVYHIVDETKRRHDWLEKTEKLIIPFLIGVVIGVAGLFLNLRGVKLVEVGQNFQKIQETNEEIQRYADRAMQASSNRHTILSGTANRITDLGKDNDLFTNAKLREMLHAEIIVTFKRLDDSRSRSTPEREGEISEIEAFQDIVTQQQTDVEHINTILKDLEGFDDSGALKGDFVRFLYESQLLNWRQYPSLYQNHAFRQSLRSLVSGGDLRRVVLKNQPLPYADLRGAYLRWGDLSNVNLVGADLREADLFEANLTNANLSSALMGISQEEGLRPVNLHNANLTGVNLSYADLRYANLEGVNLTGADLRYANLSNASLTGANLNKADLRGAILSQANLMQNVNWSEACYTHSFDYPDSQNNTKGLDGIDFQTLNGVMRNIPLDSQNVVCSAM